MSEDLASRAMHDSPYARYCGAVGRHACLEPLSEREREREDRAARLAEKHSALRGTHLRFLVLLSREYHAATVIDVPASDDALRCLQTMVRAGTRSRRLLCRFPGGCHGNRVHHRAVRRREVRSFSS